MATPSFIVVRRRFPLFLSASRFNRPDPSHFIIALCIDYVCSRPHLQCFVPSQAQDRQEKKLTYALTFCRSWGIITSEGLKLFCSLALCSLGFRAILLPRRPAPHAVDALATARQVRRLPVGFSGPSRCSAREGRCLLPANTGMSVGFPRDAGAI